MLQESVDSLFDNTRKSSAVKTESNRPVKITYLILLKASRVGLDKIC